MYKIAIFFRRTAKPNVFREIILNSLSSDFDEYCICSAFFQEPYQYKNGRISGNFSTSADMLNSLTTQNNKNNKTIKIYGLYSSNPFTYNGTWERQFRIFCQKVNALRNSNLSFLFFKFKNKSHAKIFFAKDGNGIQLAIIGSSNVSAGAFADRTQAQSWNHECDVIFWNESNIKSNEIVSSELERLNKNHSIFIADYNERHALNKLTLQDKLYFIEEELMNESNLLNL